MKKIILTLSCVGAAISFADYVVVLDQEDSNYQLESEVLYTIYSETGEWTNSSELRNCSISPIASDYYNGITFAQTTTCDQDQTKETIYYKKNKETGEVTQLSSSIESRTIELSSTDTISGTYSANSCLDVLNHNGNIGNGIYVIQLNGSNETVYCDMTNGGWTLLTSTGTDMLLTNMSSLNINKNNPPTTIDHSLYDYYPNMDSFISTLDTSTIIKFDCKDKVDGSDHEYFHRGISNFNTYFNHSAGSYTNTVECATTEDFSQNYSNEILTCIGGNDVNHRYYRSAIAEYGFALYNAGNPATLRHCGETWIGGGIDNQSQGYIWFK